MFFTKKQKTKGDLINKLTIPYIVVGIIIYVQGIRTYLEGGDTIFMLIYTSLAWILFLMAFYSYKDKKKPKQTDMLGEPFIVGGDL